MNQDDTELRSLGSNFPLEEVDLESGLRPDYDDYNDETEEGEGEGGESGDNLLLTRSERLDSRRVPDSDTFCCGKNCGLGFLTLTTLIFMLLWLAESKFSSGVLRLRLKGESCNNYGGIFSKKECAPGFHCLGGTCQLPAPPEPTPPPPCPKCRNGTIPPCPVCPPKQVCPPVKPNLVTYFDFVEQPDYWTDPGSHGYYKVVHHIPYDGCKEICAQDLRCKSLNYQGYAEMCCLMDRSYYPAARLNSTWNTATKII